MQALYEQVTEKLDLETFHPKPMVFLSSKFTKSKLPWLISQKDRLVWLILGHPDPINAYTDHENLRHILHPHVTAKTQHLEGLRRWALLIQNVDKVVNHIPAQRNVLADLLSRWGV